MDLKYLIEKQCFFGRPNKMAQPDDPTQLNLIQSLWVKLGWFLKLSWVGLGWRLSTQIKADWIKNISKLTKPDLCTIQGLKKKKKKKKNDLCMNHGL